MTSVVHQSFIKHRRGATCGSEIVEDVGTPSQQPELKAVQEA